MSDARPRREFPVGPGEDGSRLETFLRKRLGLARPKALEALRKGWVRVDGTRAKRPDLRLGAAQVVKITNFALPLPAVDDPQETPRVDVPAAAVAEARASVRLADDDLVVCAKPAGAPVHAGSGHAWGWIDAVGQALGDAAAPTPVGRIDRDTSGLLALARTRLAARRGFEALRAGTLARTYTALVLGRPEPAAGTIDLPLEKAEDEDGLERVQAGVEGARPATSRYRTVEVAGRCALLELELETGRTHQLRAHLAAIGHPILGDPRYGTDASRALARRLGLERLFLHAGQLRLPHPATGAALRFDEPLPPALAAALAAAGRI